jgi:thiol-disulfide isomerase/thioredoxin
LHTNDDAPADTSDAHPLFDKSSTAMNRRHWLYGAVAGAATLTGAGFAWREKQAADPKAPEEALWKLSFEAPDKTVVKMDGFLGKPLLLNFWATWCPPCVEEFPLLDRFYQQNTGKGWQVLGLAADNVVAVQEFLKRVPVQFPVALAGMAGVSLSKALGNLGGGLPYTLVLGANGNVLQRKMGRVSAEDLAQWVVHT